MSVDNNAQREEILNATNLAALSILGIFIPFLGIIFAMYAGSRAEKLLIKYPNNRDLKRVKHTALAGGILSVVAISFGIYYLSM
jgi:hypothetical protein